MFSSHRLLDSRSSQAATGISLSMCVFHFLFLFGCVAFTTLVFFYLFIFLRCSLLSFTLDIGKLITYLPMVWLKFKLPTCDLKFDTLLT